MEYLLVDREQWTMVYLGTQSTCMSTEEWEKLKRRTRSMIQLCLVDLMLLNVSSEYSTKKPWDKKRVFPVVNPIKRRVVRL
jgi:hypothetical protein